MTSCWHYNTQSMVIIIVNTCARTVPLDHDSWAYIKVWVRQLGVNRGLSKTTPDCPLVVQLRGYILKVSFSVCLFSQWNNNWLFLSCSLYNNFIFVIILTLWKLCLVLYVSFLMVLLNVSTLWETSVCFEHLFNLHILRTLNETHMRM